MLPLIIRNPRRLTGSVLLILLCITVYGCSSDGESGGNGKTAGMSVDAFRKEVSPDRRGERLYAKDEFYAKFGRPTRTDRDDYGTMFLFYQCNDGMARIDIADEDYIQTAMIRPYRVVKSDSWTDYRKKFVGAWESKDRMHRLEFKANSEVIKHDNGMRKEAFYRLDFYPNLVIVVDDSEQQCFCTLSGDSLKISFGEIGSDQRLENHESGTTIQYYRK